MPCTPRLHIPGCADANGSQEMHGAARSLVPLLLALLGLLVGATNEAGKAWLAEKVRPQ